MAMAARRSPISRNENPAGQSGWPGQPDDDDTASTVSIGRKEPPASAPIENAGDAPDAASEAADGPLSSGILGRYRLLGIVGAGGMGKVYAAEDSDLGRKVAIKVLHRQSTNSRKNQVRRARLLREARAMAALNHPNVITIYEVDSDGPIDYVVMELIDGQTLAEWLDVPRSWRDIVAVFVQAGQGLAAAHDAGLVHRDFKTSNVLMSRDNRVLVTDFGLARRENDADSSDTDHDFETIAATAPVIKTITRTGQVVGTPGYMSPEQHESHRVSASSDQFSFSASLYEALYRQRPFGNRFADIRAAVLAGEVRAPPAGHAVPRALQTAVMRGLSRDPCQRHPSMKALLTALQHIEQTPQRKRRRALALAILAITAFAGAGAALSLRGSANDALCQSADTQMNGIWDSTIKERIRTAFEQSGSESAHAAFTHFNQTLNGYSERWTASYNRVCTAARDHGPSSPAELNLRMSCLLERRTRIESLVRAYTRPDKRVVRKAAAAAARLPAIEACDDVDALRAGIAPPEDATTRAQVEQLRRELSYIEALNQAFATDEARRRAKAAVENARQLDYQPVLAEALYRLGDVLHSSLDFAMARGVIEEAAVVAEETNHREYLALALIDLVYLANDRSEDPEDFDRLVRRARAAIARDGDRQGLDAVLQGAIAVAQHSQGNIDQAVITMEDALARYRSIEAPRPQYVAIGLEFLADMYEERGDFDSALVSTKEAYGILRIEYGEQHPQALTTSESIGRLLRKLGQYDKARVHYQAVSRFLDTDSGQNIMNTLLGALAPSQERQRPLTIDVIDDQGHPVAEAEVVAGKWLQGDGRYLYGDGPEWHTMARVGRATTDSHGQAVVTAGASGHALIVAAEHPTAGRSMPVRAPATDSAPIRLSLARFGSLNGRISLGQLTAYTIQVTARPQTLPDSPGAGFRVYADPRGHYRFPRLAAGEYVIEVDGNHNQRWFNYAIDAVTVDAGGTTRRDIDLGTGLNTVLGQGGNDSDTELEVTVTGRDGAQIDSARIYLFPGDIRATRYEELEPVFARASYGRVLQAATTLGGAAAFAGVGPGRYSVCAVPLRGNLNDPRVSQWIAAHRGQLRVVCSQETLTDTAARRNIQLELPPMPRLPQQSPP